jgi:imidazoleglycerol-phosphate dehydratase/histidinol-phosphatase
MQLAVNLGCQGIYMGTEAAPGQEELNDSEWQDAVGLSTLSWEAIYRYLKLESRLITWERNTKETKISLKLNLDGTGKSTIDTGIAFFDHMLDQLSRHGQMDLELKVKGDLEVDEHHTIEDTALALGEAFDGAIGDKMGMERYGFCLPMDDCLAQVAIDFGGRPWLVWEAAFKREYVGKMPTEMFMHFFKSFSDAARANLNIKAEGQNEHHKIEAIFKAFAKSIKMAIKRDPEKRILPSTKGLL